MRSLPPKTAAISLELRINRREEVLADLDIIAQNDNFVQL